MIHILYTPITTEEARLILEYSGRRYDACESSGLLEKSIGHDYRPDKAVGFHNFGDLVRCDVLEKHQPITGSKIYIVDAVEDVIGFLYRRFEYLEMGDPRQLEYPPRKRNYRKVSLKNPFQTIIITEEVLKEATEYVDFGRAVILSWTRLAKRLAKNQLANLANQEN